MAVKCGDLLTCRQVPHYHTVVSRLLQGATLKAAPVDLTVGVLGVIGVAVGVLGVFGVVIGVVGVVVGVVGVVEAVGVVGAAGVVVTSNVGCVVTGACVQVWSAGAVSVIKGASKR